jgi:hypothetical protein
MLSFLRKQESIFFRNCYYLFWIPAPAGMTEWVVYVLGALRSALCAMRYAFKRADITFRHLSANYFPQMNDEGMVFIE